MFFFLPYTTTTLRNELLLCGFISFRLVQGKLICSVPAEVCHCWWYLLPADWL